MKVGKVNREANNSSKKSSKPKKTGAENITEKSNFSIKSEKHKKTKIKTEKLVETANMSKIQEKRKRRSFGDLKDEPSKKKCKPVKVERSEVREASFLFANIPDVSKPAKKKKHKTKPDSSKQPTVKAEPKLNLHLPKIQATYRPLPQVDTNSLKHKEIALTDNQAAELHSKRQTKKMLVYSGGAGGFLPKMMSLYDQCMLILMNNIDGTYSIAIVFTTNLASKIIYKFSMSVARIKRVNYRLHHKGCQTMEALQFLFLRTIPAEHQARKNWCQFNNQVFGLTQLWLKPGNEFLLIMIIFSAIDSFGGIPFEILQPILKKSTPEQLYKLEDFNSYLLEDTDPLWREHCKIEFRKKVPDEMESWREMYLRLSDEREAKLANLTRIISLKEAKKKPLEKKVKLEFRGP